jgi:ferric-dicitrate binding protein FerR (iron transport regulator)
MKLKATHNLLMKYISDRATESEKIRVLEWIEESEENRAEFNRIKNIYVYRAMGKFGKKAGRRVFFRNTLRYAAIAIFALTLSCAGYFYYLYQQKPVVHTQAEAKFKYIVNTGVKGIVDLPDGSRVWLNSSSYIICPQKFAVNCREVELEGEGYFEVVPDKNWPMMVKTSKDYTVKVTGTKFNLSSYSDDDKLVVTLISGEVSLINTRKNKVIKMEPNQELVIKSEKPRLSDNANIERNTAWKKGVLLFDNTPMSEVIKKMERWYGVKIIVNDPKILECNFTAKFKSESVSQVLEILKLSSNIKYTIEDTTITLLSI